MSPDDFAKSMEDRGESMMTILLRMMAAGMAGSERKHREAKSSDAELLMALFDNNRALRLKRLMAEQFADLEYCHGCVQRPERIDAGHRAE